MVIKGLFCSPTVTRGAAGQGLRRDGEFTMQESQNRLQERDDNWPEEDTS
jgi:hypothetical protein